jgi:hypothetical protein
VALLVVSLGRSHQAKPAHRRRRQNASRRLHQSRPAWSSANALLERWCVGKEGGKPSRNVGERHIVQFTLGPDAIRFLAITVREVVERGSFDIAVGPIPRASRQRSSESPESEDLRCLPATR